MNSSNVFFLLTILYLSVCGVTADGKYKHDILTNPQDDCGNFCGQLNTKTTKSECGDPDKRNDKILLVHHSSDKNEDETEYFEVKNLECVAACPANYQIYEKTKVCVKVEDEFRKELSKPDDKPDNKVVDELNYTWWIVGGVAALLVVALIIAFVFIKMRSG